MKSFLFALSKAFIAFSLFFILLNSAFSQTNVSGVISSNTTWTKAASPYIITNNLLVNSGVVLTIESGVEIRFESNLYLKVQGQIIANGTSNEMIKFTSNKSVKARGDWGKIWLISTTSSFDGGYNYLSGSLFNNCIIEYAQEGIRFDDAQIVLINSRITNNTIGLSFKKSNNSLFKNNFISENSDGVNTSIGTENYGVGLNTQVKFIENKIVNNSNVGLSFGGYMINSNFNLFKGNLVANNGGIGLNFSWGDVVQGFNNNTIEYNIIYNNGGTGLVICRDQNFIKKNVILKNKGDGIGLSGTYIYIGNQIENNIIGFNQNRAIDMSSNNFSTVKFNNIFFSGRKNQFPAVDFPRSYIESTANVINFNTISYSNSNDFEFNYGPNNLKNNNFIGRRDGYFVKVTARGTFTIDAKNNYWDSSDLLAQGIFDNGDDFELGTVDVSTPTNSPIITAPIAFVTNVKKTLSNGRVVLTWTANQESDIAGYKIYHGGFTGYSYTNSVDAGNVLTYTLPVGVGIDEDIAVTAYDTSKDGTDDQFDGNESWYSPANKAPGKPIISSISPSERKIDIAWGVVANTDKYNVYSSLDGINYSLQASIKGTSYSHTNLNTLQQRYYYKVAAFDSLDLSYTNYGLEGVLSEVSDSKPANKGAISSVETVTKAVKLNLAYNSSISNIENYKIYRASTNEARQLIKTLAVTNSFYVDSVSTDKLYTYDVTISNSTEESDTSAIKTAVSFSVPLFVKSFNDKLNLATSDSLRWAFNSLATKYQIQLDTVNTFASAALVSSISTNDFYSTSNLIKDKYVFYRVRAGDENGYSDWTAIQRIQLASRKHSIDSVYSYTNQIKLKLNIGTYLGIDSIYIYRKTASAARALIFKAPKNQVYFQDNVSNGIYYTYDIVLKSASDQSESSIERRVAAFSSPVLTFPIENQADIKNNTTFKWSRSTLADKYTIELDTSSLFNSPQLVRVTSSDTVYIKSTFLQNEYYYWRIKAGDINGFSNWSTTRKLQTFVASPVFSEVKPSNKKSLLKFSLSSWKNISKIYILRDTITSPQKIIDSSSVFISEYLDTLNLKLNKKYYYSLRLVNKQGVFSDFAASVLSIPFNLKPQIKPLADKTINNVGEFNFVRSVYSSSGSNDLDGKITNYKWFVNDSLVNSTDSILVYYFRHGTHSVKLVIADNDGDKDSSTASVSLNSFVKTFKGGFLGGITALNPNVIYTADSNYDPVSGASVNILNRSGNSIYPLVVSSKILTTPSVATDSSVFITSGSSLNGFNKSGAPLWSTIPLGGLSYVTPTIDSLFNRIYVGVSNKNFLAIDYKTGKVAWNIIGDAAINSSAVITGDRKLIFTSQSGTLYGFDIKSNVVQTVAKWKLNLGEVVSKSPAVDKSNNLYIGTESGNLLKIRLNSDGTIEQLWKTNLVASIQVSPVIDADGNVYVGNKVGSFFKVNPTTGAILWKFETGAEITSTPSISEFGNIYVANMSGLTFALNANKEVKWKYQADSPISANILYINNMLYLGTESGKLIALYDNPTTNTLNTSLSTNSITPSKGKQTLKDNMSGSLVTSNREMNQTVANNTFKEPVWGTFQGNYRRSGSKSFECPSIPKLFVPACSDLAETIRVSTDNMTNRYWVINEQIQTALVDSAITVKVTDKVKIMAYNSVGCNVFSETPIKLQSAVISKPQIVTNTGTNKFCEGSSIILNAKDSYKNYQWNFSTFAISGSTEKSLSTSLPGAYSITAINEFGCKATSDIVLIMTTPTPVAPIIAIENKATLVSNLAGITWFKDGIALPDTAQKLNLKADGLYTAKITKNGCVSPLSNSVRYNSVIILGINKESQFTISPNPFSVYLKIEFPEKFGPKVDVEIYNLTGNVIWKSKDLSSGEKINLESLNQGVYLLKLINVSGESLESKVIKL